MKFAEYTTNRMPRPSRFNESAYLQVYGRSPAYEAMVEPFTLCTATMNDNKLGALEERSMPGVVVGYKTVSTNVTCEMLNLATGRINVSADVRIIRDARISRATWREILGEEETDSIEWDKFLPVEGWQEHGVGITMEEGKLTDMVASGEDRKRKFNSVGGVMDTTDERGEKRQRIRGDRKGLRGIMEDTEGEIEGNKGEQKEKGGEQGKRKGETERKERDERYRKREEGKIKRQEVLIWDIQTSYSQQRERRGGEIGEGKRGEWAIGEYQVVMELPEQTISAEDEFHVGRIAETFMAENVLPQKVALGEERYRKAFERAMEEEWKDMTEVLQILGKPVPREKLEPEAQVIGMKWNFELKMDRENWAKARLNARGDEERIEEEEYICFNSEKDHD